MKYLDIIYSVILYILKIIVFTSAFASLLLPFELTFTQRYSLGFILYLFYTRDLKIKIKINEETKSD